MIVFLIVTYLVISLALMGIRDKMDKLAKAMELNFDEEHLEENWHRAREYYNEIEDGHWDNILKEAKAMLGDTQIYPRPGKRLYGPPGGLKFYSNDVF
jgi:hypothetical protein